MAPYPPTPDARPLSHRHSLAGLPPPAPSTSPYPPLGRAQTQHYAPSPPTAVPPFQHHNSEGTHPYRSSFPSGAGGAAGLVPIHEAITLSRERTLRAQNPVARGLRPGGYASAPPPPVAPVPPVRPSPPHQSSSSSSNEGGGTFKKLLRGRRTSTASHPPAAGNSPYPPIRPTSSASTSAGRPTLSSPSFGPPRRPGSTSPYPPASPASPYPPISPASAGPYPPFVSTAAASLSAAAPHPNPYGGFVPAPPPGATHAIAPSAYAAAAPAGLDRAAREKSPAELEQEAVQRACEQGLAEEQRRLSALAAEEERLLRLTLEESTSSAALEQLRVNALARERALAEERALREALLSSRSEAEGRVRSERRRRVEEEKEVQRAMAVSRRESEDKGKGKGKARAEDAPEEGEEDEIERREREALELAMQLSLQEEEKRRLWRGGYAGATGGADEGERNPPFADAATSTHTADPFAGSSTAPNPALASSSSFDDLPPAYELPPHARELDEPDDVIIGPGRPLPHPPAPPPPSGAAPAQLQRLADAKHASGAYAPAQAYPSFAPYAHNGGGAAASLVGSESSGALSVAASAGSFAEEGAYSGSSYAPSVAEEPEVLPAEDPFSDRFAEEEPPSGVVGPHAEAAAPPQPQRQDLFAAVLARRASNRPVQHMLTHDAGPASEAYPSRPVLAVDLADAYPSAAAVRIGEQEPTPRAVVPPAIPLAAQAISSPATPEPVTYLSPPGSARLPSTSAPASPASITSLRSDPSAGGFVEDVGALVPFADEHVLRDVRWGFVDDEMSAVGRYPRLEHEGDFPRGAQLSAVRTAEGAQPYRAFAVEARTWQGLLVYLMWHGNSRFEAAPHDLQADKSGHGLQATVSVDFYRSGRSSSSAVSIRPPRVRVRLTLLPLDPNAPARRPSSSFVLCAPAALEPVNPSIRLVLEHRPILPLALADLATLLSQAHTASRSAMRLARTGPSAPPTGADRRIVLALAVDLFRRLNGEEVRPAGEEDGVGGAEEEVSVLDRLKARLRRRRGPRVIEGAGGGSVAGGGALPEGATLITPFSLD
ncbi:hypothetical protein JCM10450v2_001298 [Rhodotorula kratochvilovae]